MAALAAFMMLSAGAAHAATRAHAASTANTALILTDSVTTPGPTPTGESLEQYEAEQAGFTVTNVDGATWDSMTAAQFAQYQVVIIGDPTCGGPSSFAAAETNASVWEPVVMSSGGNKVLIGTDPVYHFTFGSGPNADKLVKNGIAYAGNLAGSTGAYVDLTCAYGSSAPGTPVPLLDGLSSHGPGSFTVGGAPCAGSIAIIAQSGPTSGLNDSDLSNWSCSVHEFFDKFPSDYTPLALATDPSVPVTYTGTDVSTGATVSGSPYIMLSGGGVVVKSNLVLSPATQSLTQGGSASVTANLTSGGSPVSGNSVTFDITSGPDAGQTFTGNTDSSGNVTFTFTNTGGAGTDQIVGTTVVSGVTEQGTASVTWTSGGGGTITVTPLPVKCVENCVDLLKVATFTDPNSSDTASDFVATINWGDGTSSAGTITLSGGVFTISGHHKYHPAKTYTITVTITKTDGTAEPGATTTATIRLRGTSHGALTRAKSQHKAKHKARHIARRR